MLHLAEPGSGAVRGCLQTKPVFFDLSAPGRYAPYWESQGMAQKLWHWDYTLLHARRAKNSIYQALN